MTQKPMLWLWCKVGVGARSLHASSVKCQVVRGEVDMERLARAIVIVCGPWGLSLFCAPWAKFLIRACCYILRPCTLLLTPEI